MKNFEKPMILKSTEFLGINFTFLICIKISHDADYDNKRNHQNNQ